MRFRSLLLLFLFLPFFVFAGDNLSYGVPVTTDLCISREGFALGYSHKYRQAIWVSYILTKDNLEKEQVKRRNRFRPDPAITHQPVQPKDYTRTGYDRGHLAPAADMTYTYNTMLHSFFMSNISPQIPGCNRGIWKRVEMQTRKWALQEGRLYIITGPIFKGGEKLLGKTNIPIPTAFYKIVLDLTPPVKMIAFIVPNQTTKKRVPSFVVPVDEVEAITGYDFFNTMDEQLEERLEKEADFSAW